MRETLENERQRKLTLMQELEVEKADREALSEKNRELEESLECLRKTVTNMDEIFDEKKRKIAMLEKELLVKEKDSSERMLEQKMYEEILENHKFEARELTKSMQELADRSDEYAREVADLRKQLVKKEAAFVNAQKRQRDAEMNLEDLDKKLRTEVTEKINVKKEAGKIILQNRKLKERLQGGGGN